MKRDRLQSVVTVSLTLAILMIASVMVHREFIAGPVLPEPVVPPPVFVEGWEEIAAAGVTLGAPTASVRIVEFADLQCPACRAYQPVLSAVRAKFRKDVAFVFVHLPLGMHKQAYPAARAAECARVSGKFDEFVDAAYAKQAVLQSEGWSELARTAGVANLGQFEQCVVDSLPHPAVEAGRAIAKRFDVNETPTIIVNGWRYEFPPGPEELTNLIRSLMRGELPAAAQQRQVVMPTRRTENGVTILTHDATAFERALRLSLDPVPLAVAGGPDADPAYDLTDARAFSLLADGRIAAFSIGRSRLLVFAADGQAQKSWGGTGQGPAEFRNVSSMIVARGDTLVLPDLGNTRMAWVTPDRGTVRTSSLQGLLPSRSTDRIAGMLPGERAVLFSGGRVQPVDLGKRERPPATVALVALQSAGRVIANVPDLETVGITTRYQGEVRTESATLGFTRRAVVAVWDTLIVTGSGDGYRLDLRNANGRVLQTLSVAVPRRVVSTAMRQDLIDTRLRQMAEYREPPRDLNESQRLVREAPFADSLPPYHAIFVSPDQTLWVVDGLTPADTAWHATAFRRDGAIVGRLRGVGTSRPVAFGNDRVLVRRIDADGVVALEARRIVPAR